MTVAATTRIAVMRGTFADDFGDELDAWDSGAVDPAQRPETITPAAGIAASLVQRTRVVFDPASGEARTVTTHTCRCAALVEVRDGDRIRDLRDGKVYAVDGAVAESRTITGARALEFGVRRTSGE